jgi:hypothetical protein
MGHKAGPCTATFNDLLCFCVNITVDREIKSMKLSCKTFIPVFPEIKSLGKNIIKMTHELYIFNLVETS